MSTRLIIVCLRRLEALTFFVRGLKYVQPQLTNRHSYCVVYKFVVGPAEVYVRRDLSSTPSRDPEDFLHYDKLLVVGVLFLCISLCLHCLTTSSVFYAMEKEQIETSKIRSMGKKVLNSFFQKFQNGQYIDNISRQIRKY